MIGLNVFCKSVANSIASLDKTSKELNCPFGVADVTKSEELKKVLEKCGENIHGLAYCAGAIDLKSLSFAHENDYLESFKVNTLGAITSIKSLKDSLKKNNGSILLFSSIAVKSGFTNQSVIATAKGGIEALTISLAA